MIDILKLDSTKYVSSIYNIPGEPITSLDNMSKYFDRSKTLILSDTLQDLKDLKKSNFTTGTISPGSKIYFSSDSEISPLYLSKLKEYNTKIKRVLKPENADVIVISTNTNYNDIIYITSKYVGNQRVQFGYYNEEEEDKTSLEHIFGMPFYFSLQADNAKIAQKYFLIDKYPNKIVTDIDFIKYVFQFLPVIDDDTYNNVISMLNNSDKSVRHIGADCLQYYNFSNHIWDLFNFYKTRDTRYYSRFKPSLSEQFIACALNIHLSWSYSNTSYSTIKIHVKQVMENPLNTQSANDIAQKIINRYLDDIKNDYSFNAINDALNTIGYTIKLEKLPDDQNGETESGD